ncbi:MAG: hypothetical protein WCG85_13410 [Polyangia bacterium]
MPVHPRARGTERRRHASYGKCRFIGEAQRHGKPPSGAVDQTPSQTFAFALLIDGDSYLLQDHKVAIDGALGASEVGRGARDGQSSTLVE